MLRVYAPFVERTAVSFETEAPTVEAFAARMTPALPWLVDEAGSFAYATPHRARAAYRWSVETSVYVAESRRSRGTARALYERLLGLLRLQGYATALAGITLPNEPSRAFHAAMGFERVGVYPGVGHKFGRWHDTEWWSLALRRGEPPAILPTPEAIAIDDGIDAPIDRLRALGVEVSRDFPAQRTWVGMSLEELWARLS